MIDRCGNCEGTYYDFEELSSIIKLIEIRNSIELDEPEIETMDPPARLLYRCPEDGEKMERKDYGGVVVDICGKCKGAWLDDGELVSLKATEDHIRNNLNLYVRLASNTMAEKSGGG